MWKFEMDRSRPSCAFMGSELCLYASSVVISGLFDLLCLSMTNALSSVV